MHLKIVSSFILYVSCCVFLSKKIPSIFCSTQTQDSKKKLSPQNKNQKTKLRHFYPALYVFSWPYLLFELNHSPYNSTWPRYKQVVHAKRAIPYLTLLQFLSYGIVVFLHKSDVKFVERVWRYILTLLLFDFFGTKFRTFEYTSGRFIF